MAIDTADGIRVKPETFKLYEFSEVLHGGQGWGVVYIYARSLDEALQFILTEAQDDNFASYYTNNWLQILKDIAYPQFDIEEVKNRVWKENPVPRGLIGNESAVIWNRRKAVINDMWRAMPLEHLRTHLRNQPTVTDNVLYGVYLGGTS